MQSGFIFLVFVIKCPFSCPFLVQSLSSVELFLLSFYHHPEEGTGCPRNSNYTFIVFCVILFGPCTDALPGILIMQFVTIHTSTHLFWPTQWFPLLSVSRSLDYNHYWCQHYLIPLWLKYGGFAHSIPYLKLHRI